MDLSAFGRGNGSVTDMAFSNEINCRDKSLGHELYGHIDMLLRGDEVKGGLHGPIRTEDHPEKTEGNFNGPLEQQIYDRSNEAETNYEQHQQ